MKVLFFPRISLFAVVAYVSGALVIGLLFVLTLLLLVVLGIAMSPRAVAAVTVVGLHCSPNHPGPPYLIRADPAARATVAPMTGGC